MFLAKGKIYAFLLVLLYYSFSGYILDTFSSRPIDSYGSLMADIILICLGFFSLGFEKNKVFTWIFLAFLISSTITFLINRINIFIHLNGMREYLIVFSTLLFINHIFNSKYCLYFHAKIIGFCWIFLLLQIPISLYQFFQYGAGDEVGGGFGSGGSGILTLSIFIVIFFLLVNMGITNKEKNFHLPRIILFVPFLLPTFINETKLTFVLIVLFFLLLLKFRFDNLIKVVGIGLLAFSFFIMFEIIYTKTKNESSVVKREISYEKIFSSDFLARYLTSEETRNGKDVSRLTKINIAYFIIYEHPMSLLFGKGIGLFKGGSIMDASQFSKRFDWLLSGTRPYLFFLLIQGGLIGTFLIMLLLFLPLYPNNINSPPFILKRIRLFLIILLSLILIYNPAFRSGGFVIIFSYVSLFIYNSERFLHLKNPVPKYESSSNTLNLHPQHA